MNLTQLMDVTILDITTGKQQVLTKEQELEYAKQLANFQINRIKNKQCEYAYEVELEKISMPKDDPTFNALNCYQKYKKHTHHPTISPILEYYHRDLFDLCLDKINKKRQMHEKECKLPVPCCNKIECPVIMFYNIILNFNLFA